MLLTFLLLISTSLIQGLTISRCKPSEKPLGPESLCCGIDSSGGNRIFGGDATSLEAYPWLARIIYDLKPEYEDLLCGASLISSRYVLTAAHCVVGDVLQYGSPIDVALGDYDISNDGPDCMEAVGGGIDCTDGATTIVIDTVSAHEGYREDTNKNDIALIRLRDEAPYTDFIRPICLPSADVTADPAQDLEFVVAGWGSIKQKIRNGEIINKYGDAKRHVDVPFVPLEKCQRIFDVGKGQLCAGGVKGKDSCSGDSGGPLMYQNNTIYELVGIVSYGNEMCGRSKKPGVYTNVYEYLLWIMKQIQMENRKMN